MTRKARSVVVLYSALLAFSAAGVAYNLGRDVPLAVGYAISFAVGAWTAWAIWRDR